MLGIAIGDLLPAAVAVAISPLPVAATILMPLGPRAATSGPPFLSAGSAAWESSAR